MKKKPSKDDIIKIIAKILKMSAQKVEKIDNYTKMENWDSLAQLDIISALDKKLNGKIGKIEFINVEYVQDWATGVKVDNDGTAITPVVDGTTYYRWGNSPPDEWARIGGIGNGERSMSAMKS